MSHTPGPWEYDGKFQVCIPHEVGLTCFRTNPEDARLIVAAPEMYEALIIVSKLKGFEPDEPYGVIVRNAIAKAEGK